MRQKVQSPPPQPASSSTASKQISSFKPGAAPGIESSNAGDADYARERL